MTFMPSGHWIHIEGDALDLPDRCAAKDAGPVVCPYWTTNIINSKDEVSDTASEDMKKRSLPFTIRPTAEERK